MLFIVCARNREVQKKWVIEHGFDWMHNVQMMMIYRLISLLLFSWNNDLIMVCKIARDSIFYGMISIRFSCLLNATAIFIVDCSECMRAA